MDEHELCNLSGCRVLVTRAAHQAKSLCQLIDELEGRALHLPAIEICAIEPGKSLAKLLKRIDRFDVAIFVSANAVEWGLYLLPGEKLPDSIVIAAVGQATALALAKRGYTVTVVPEQGFDSEALLATPELGASRIAGKSVVIFRGEGGRALLGSALRKRGARVKYAEVYQRRCPKSRTVDGIEWRLEDIDVATATSNMVLDNLFTLFGDDERDRLQNLPLVVISERMRAHARALGCKQVILAPGPGDREVVEAICSWLS